MMGRTIERKTKFSSRVKWPSSAEVCSGQVVYCRMLQGEDGEMGKGGRSQAEVKFRGVPDLPDWAARPLGSN
jgi:hypothetical protein